MPAISLSDQENAGVTHIVAGPFESKLVTEGQWLKSFECVAGCVSRDGTREVPRGEVHEFLMRSEESNIYPYFKQRGVFLGNLRPRSEISCQPSFLWPSGTTFYNIDENTPDLEVQTSGRYDRQCTVYIPPGYLAGTPAPVMIKTDGNDLQSLSLTLDRLIYQKKIPPVVVIGIMSGGARPGEMFSGPGSQQSWEYDDVSDAYAQFIETEVLPRVAKEFNITFTSNPDGRATWGVGSGAAAAFNMARQRPDLFRRVISFSGCFINEQYPWRCDCPKGNWDMPEWIAGSAKKPLRVWLHVGELDLGHETSPSFCHNVVVANREMGATLKAKGYDYQLYLALQSGHADGDVIANLLPSALEYAWQDYACD